MGQRGKLAVLHAVQYTVLLTVVNMAVDSHIHDLEYFKYPTFLAVTLFFTWKPHGKLYAKLLTSPGFG